MPPKRKASTTVSEEPTPKRQTRRSGLTAETSTPATKTRRRPVDNSPVATPTKRRGRQRDDSPSLGSLKENDNLGSKRRKRTKDTTTHDELFGHYSSADTDDELLLSPTKPKRGRPIKALPTGTPTRNGIHKAVFDAVEIGTPSKRATRSTPAVRRERSASPISLPPVTPRKRKVKPSETAEEPQLKVWALSPSVIPPSPLQTSQSPLKSTAPVELPKNLPKSLPHHLIPCLNAQKRAILKSLQRPPDFQSSQNDAGDSDEEEESANEVALRQLRDLLAGTVTRGEGNSCLLLGPRNSGKTRLVEHCISELPGNPIIIRLSGWTEHNDRLAMREIAHQLSRQTGKTFLADADEDTNDAKVVDDEENPFIDHDTDAVPLALPPPSHLPALISTIPALPRATIIVLDAFDLFALHARQSLLYCLLDTVQSCRAGAGRQALAVIGVTTRIDTINMLEKRVKSRFSGRMIRAAAPCRVKTWLGLARQMLSVPAELPLSEDVEGDAVASEWQGLWTVAVNRFLEDESVGRSFVDAFSVTRDVKMLCRILTGMVLNLNSTSPFPLAAQLTAATTAQRIRVPFPLIHTLPYPALCLLIAAMHAYTAGHEVFTFEMLHESFGDQVRASAAAPVQFNGSNIGMVRCSREVLMNAFEELTRLRILVSAVAPSSSVAREFHKYRCVMDYEDVKKAILKTGHMHLKKWMNKAQ
ncbi:hypothetical protein HGRIS_009581 [Hohenbuehelia grisea]|uniref:Origin recognition complex subunit 4 n=1 Tax=Hohenbuehelia grisea TaxID=104357 RepID=A0ABR3J1L7_9AGAR